MPRIQPEIAPRIPMRPFESPFVGTGAAVPAARKFIRRNQPQSPSQESNTPSTVHFRGGVCACAVHCTHGHGQQAILCNWTPLSACSGTSYLMHVQYCTHALHRESISTGRSKLMSNPILRGYDWSNLPHVSRQCFTILVGGG
jgi:hypothetical protein